MTETLNETQFRVWIAVSLSRAGNLRAHQTMPMSGDIWREFTRDCRIEYGDPDYSWTREGAEIVAHEYAIQYWDSEP